MGKRIFQWSVVAAMAASFFMTLAKIAGDTTKYQWDLKAYFNGPLKWLEGENPYSTVSFVYPPLTLYFFRLFSIFEYERFFLIFLVVKALCFFLLLHLWWKHFRERLRVEVFLLVVWLGFNATFRIDFEAGNISVFETLILFMAFTAFLKNRLNLFVGLVVVAGCFKITPLFFLLLLPLTNHWRHFAWGCGAYGLFWVLNLAIFPGFSVDFFHQAIIRTIESGNVCPSLLGLISNMMGSIFSLKDERAWEIGRPIYIVVASALLWWMGRLVYESKIKDRRFLLLFSILVYALAGPRTKDYMYMLVIPSIIYAVAEFNLKVRPWMFLLLVMIITTKNEPPLLFQTVFNLFWEYYAWVVSAIFLTFYVKAIKQPRPSVVDF